MITALIHLGYLAYHSRTRMAFIPNEEIRSEFASVLEESKWSEFIEYQKASKELLEATLDMDGGTVAEYIEKYIPNMCPPLNTMMKILSAVCSQ